MDDRSNMTDEWNAVARSLLFVNAVLLKQMTSQIRVLVYEKRWSAGVTVGAESRGMSTLARVGARSKVEVCKLSTFVARL